MKQMIQITKVPVQMEVEAGQTQPVVKGRPTQVNKDTFTLRPSAQSTHVPPPPAPGPGTLGWKA